MAVVENIRPWGRWATFGLGVLALFAGQAVALIALIWWTGQGLMHWANVAGDGVAVTFVVCIATPVQVLLLIEMSRHSGISAADYLGFKLPQKRQLIIGIVAVLAVTAIADGVSRLIGQNSVTPFQFDIYRTASRAGWLPFLWLAIVIVAPIGEETLFRGFLFRGWQRSSRDVWFAIAATSLFWSVIHVQYNPYVIGQVFVIGLVLGWFRWISGSTILTMVLHAVVNCEGMIETLLVFHGGR
jgi:membrane protease YdiL (CAAX protease family)